METRRNPLAPARLGPAAAGALSLALALLHAGPAEAEIATKDPQFPARERIVYAETLGDRRGTAVQELRRVTQGKESWYEVTMASERNRSTARLKARTLSPFYSETTTTAEDSEIRRVTELVSLSAELKADEMGILDMATFPTQLRGFPWGMTTQAKLVMLGAGSGQAFGLEFSVAGRERISVAGGTFECYKAYLGLSGIWSAVFPRTTLWFSVSPPHVLVKSEGLSGGPGSPKRVLELQSYSAD